MKLLNEPNNGRNNLLVRDIVEASSCGPYNPDPLLRVKLLADLHLAPQTEVDPDFCTSPQAVGSQPSLSIL